LAPGLPSPARPNDDCQAGGVELQATAFGGLRPAMNAIRCDIVWSGLNLSDGLLEVADGFAYMNTGLQSRSTGRTWSLSSWV
jgi:polar amino acid transport system substrate-binding protein